MGPPSRPAPAGTTGYVDAQGAERGPGRNPQRGSNPGWLAAAAAAGVLIGATAVGVFGQDPETPAVVVVGNQPAAVAPQGDIRNGQVETYDLPSGGAPTVSGDDRQEGTGPATAKAPEAAGQNDRAVGTEQRYYTDCTQPRQAGAAPIRQTEPGYRAELDRNRNGLACEDGE